MKSPLSGAGTAICFALPVYKETESPVVVPRSPGDGTLGVLVLVLLQSYNEAL